MDAAVVVLAAGASTRMGEPKQLLPLAGRPVLQHVLDAAAAAGAGPVVLVLGADHRRIAEAVALPAGGRAVVNPDFADGQSGSLRVGLAALGPEVGRAVIVLGDQPGVASAAIAAVASASGPIVRARYGGAPGHPVALDRAVWEEALSGGGDRGARALIARRPELVRHVDLPGPPPPDLDTPADYLAAVATSGR